MTFFGIETTGTPAQHLDGGTRTENSETIHPQLRRFLRSQRHMCPTRKKMHPKRVHFVRRIPRHLKKCSLGSPRQVLRPCRGCYCAPSPPPIFHAVFSLTHHMCGSLHVPRHHNMRRFVDKRTLHERVFLVGTDGTQNVRVEKSEMFETGR